MAVRKIATIGHPVLRQQARLLTKEELRSDDVQRFIELGWKNVDFWVFPTGTHDIYWGNFVDTAARLYAGGTPWTPPLQRPEPKPGDIVTFLVFWPAYEKRMKIDWESSPYNQAYWKNFQAMKYWHTEWMHLRDKSPNLSAGSEDAHQDEQRRQEARKFRAENADKPLTEQELNFYILMRTAGENENGYIKRPDYFDAYLRYLHDSLLRCVAQPGVLTKILLFSTAQQVVDTLVKGLGAAISGIRIAGT